MNFLKYRRFESSSSAFLCSLSLVYHCSLVFNVNICHFYYVFRMLVLLKFEKLSENCHWFYILIKTLLQMLMFNSVRQVEQIFCLGAI